MNFCHKERMTGLRLRCCSREILRRIASLYYGDFFSSRVNALSPTGIARVKSALTFSLIYLFLAPVAFADNNVVETDSAGNSSAPALSATATSTSTLPLGSPDWLQVVSTCEQLKQEIRTRFGAVSDLSKFDAEKRLQLEMVITVACSERFAGCRFRACAERRSSASASSADDSGMASSEIGDAAHSSSTSSELSVEVSSSLVTLSEQASSMRGMARSVISQIELPPVELDGSSGSTSEQSANQISQSASEGSSAEASSAEKNSMEASSPLAASQQSSSTRTSPFIVDPLAWLTREMTCQEFLEQTQVRFGFFGTYQELPEEKRQEMRRVLQAACDARFLHCQFAACPLEGREVSEAANLLIAGESSDAGSSVAPPVTSSGAESSLPKSDLVGSASASSESESGSGDADWEFYRKLVARKSRERQSLIAEAEKREKELGFTWSRFFIPEDVEEERDQVLREPQAERKDSPKTVDAPAVSGSGASTAEPKRQAAKDAESRQGSASRDSRAADGGRRVTGGDNAKGGGEAETNWLDQEAVDLQIGVLPPLPPDPPADPHRRKD